MRGGFGQAGRYRHKRSRLIRTGEYFHMHYAGKKGFNPLSAKKTTGPTLNLWQLSDIVDRIVSEKKAEQKDEKVVVDLKQLGFRKLLGTGAISRAVQVTIDECSEGALKKIKDAGGDAVLRQASAASKPAPSK